MNAPKFPRNVCRVFYQPDLYLRVFALTLIFFVYGIPLLAQGNISGSFVGSVTEKGTNAKIQDATVIFRNLDTGSQTATRSGNDGQFSKTSLPPGVYEIEVRADGYLPEKKVQTLYATRPNDVVPVPFELSRTAGGPIDPSIPVITTPTPAPSTTAADNSQQDRAVTDEDQTIGLNPRRGGAFDMRNVRGLPLGGTTLTRTFDELAFFVLGVNPPPQAIGNTVGPGIGGGIGTSGQFSVNGLRSRANNFTVDGSDNNDEDIGVRRQGFFTLVPQPIESIQEFQIITLLAPAEFGRNLGGQVNAISRSGGNRLRGSIFGLGNADFLNARNFFDNADGDITTSLQGIQVDGTSVPVFQDGQEVQVFNDAGEKDEFSLLQGGIAIGGPIVKNRLFFFVSGEGQFMNGSNERHFAVPTVEERGIFGTGAQGFIGDAGNGQVFPLFATAFRSEAVYSLFPFPNDPTGVYGRNTYTEALSTDAHGLMLSSKADWNAFRINNNQQMLTVRYNYTDDERDLTDVGGALFSAIRPLVRTDNFSSYLTGGLTANVSNELRFSYGRTRLRFDDLGNDFLRPSRLLNETEDTRFLLSSQYFSNNTIARCAGRPPCSRSTLDLPSGVDFLRAFRGDGRPANTEDSDLGYIGQIIIGGFSPVGVDVFNFPQERTNDTFQFADTLRWQFNANGRHGLAVGTDIRRVFLKSDLPRNSRPLVTFYGALGTDGLLYSPADLAAVGAATGFFQTLVLPGSDAKINLSYNQLNFFVQDDWRAASNLSFNLGLRYELNTTPKEADQKIENTFGLSLPSFLSGLNQFIDGRTSIYDTDKNNFAPRVGVAYAPSSNTVIRGGFGMYFDQILGAVVSQSRNVYPTFTTANFGGGVLTDNGGIFTFFNPRDAIFDPSNGFVCNFADILFGVRVPCASPDEGSIFLIQPGTLNTINPALTPAQVQVALQDLFNLFPSNEDLPGSSFGITIPTRQLDTPYSYQYSIGIEHQLFRNTFVSAAYVGTSGRDLLRFTTPNLGSNYVALVDGIFFDDVNCDGTDENIGFCEPITLGTTNSPSRSVGNVGAINQFETTGRSRYHSLQLELRGRLAQTFQYRANYAYGRVKDDVSDVFDLAGAFSLPQNSVNFAGEYAFANFDVRHRFTYNFLYDTPELTDSNGLVRFILGGWQIAGTGKFNTGQPFTVNTVFDVNQDGNLTDRLDNTQQITETDDRSRPLQVSGDLISMLAPFGTDGAVPRNSFRAGSVLDLDLTFAKRFKFQEDQDFQFRIDVFNFINRANFGVPVRFLEFPSFGRATETITPGRRIQFMLRYNF
ncbi:MAG: TonB-dependent receptor [Pyrinomonadaceae bacterium]